MYNPKHSPILISSLLLALLLGCGASPSTSSSSSASAASSQDNGVVQFQLDGTDWISGPPGHPELKYEEEAITDGTSLVRIEAYAADGSHLALNVYSTSGLGPGTYPITDQGMSAFLKFEEQGGINYVTNGMPDNPGSITITELTAEKVVGTFSFRMRSVGNPEDIREVTAGTFDVRFTTY